MSKKLRREFRDRHLTPDEIAADNEVRRKVIAEFPPESSVGTDQTSSLSGLLKRSIRESRKSVDEIAQEAGISPALIAQFLSGERDIRLTTADKLAQTLGLDVTAE